MLKKLFLGLVLLASGLFAGETGPVRLALNPEGTSGGQTGQLRFYELAANGSNYVSLKAPDSITATLNFILPSVDGTNGQALVTNGSGLLTWTTISGLLPDGTYGDIVVTGSGSTLTVGNNAITTAKIANSNVTLAKIANGTALSVLGVTGNASAAYADIAAGSDHQVLRRSGSAVAFGALNLAQSAAVTGILAGANGGTNNAFMQFTGPTTSTKTYTLPDATTTILTTNSAVTVGQGGTGLAAGTSGGVPYFNSTSTMASSAALTASQLVLGGGAGAAPTTLAAPSSGQLLVGNTTTPAWATMSGDATLANTGALTVANNAITTAKINDGAVTGAKLESRVRPNYNYLINGDFAIDQRAVAAGSVIDDVYCLDRWVYLNNGSFASRMYQGTANPDTGSKYYGACTHTVATSRFAVEQIIEGKNMWHLRGKDVILQARVRTTEASKDVRACVISWTGTEDSVTSDVVNTWTSTTYTINNFFINNASLATISVSSAVTPGTTWTDISVTHTVNASATNLIVLFICNASAISANEEFQISKAGLYEGTELRTWMPRHIAEELTLCQRYFRKIGGSASSVKLCMGQCYNSTSLEGLIKFDIPMRSTPAVSFSGSAFEAYNSAGSNQAMDDPAFGSQCPEGFHFSLSASSGNPFTAGHSSVVRTNGSTTYFTADSEL